MTRSIGETSSSYRYENTFSTEYVIIHFDTIFFKLRFYIYLRNLLMVWNNLS